MPIQNKPPNSEGKQMQRNLTTDTKWIQPVVTEKTTNEILAAGESNFTPTRTPNILALSREERDSVNALLGAHSKLEEMMSKESTVLDNLLSTTKSVIEGQKELTNMYNKAISGISSDAGKVTSASTSLSGFANNYSNALSALETSNSSFEQNNKTILQLQGDLKTVIKGISDASVNLEKISEMAVNLEKTTDDISSVSDELKISKNILYSTNAEISNSKITFDEASENLNKNSIDLDKIKKEVRTSLIESNELIKSLIENITKLVSMVNEGVFDLSSIHDEVSKIKTETKKEIVRLNNATESVILGFKKSTEDANLATKQILSNNVALQKLTSKSSDFEKQFTGSLGMLEEAQTIVKSEMKHSLHVSVKERVFYAIFIIIALLNVTVFLWRGLDVLIYIIRGQETSMNVFYSVIVSGVGIMFSFLSAASISSMFRYENASRKMFWWLLFLSILISVCGLVLPSLLDVVEFLVEYF